LATKKHRTIKVAEQVNYDVRFIKKCICLRRAMVTLSPYIPDIKMKFESNLILEGRIRIRDKDYIIQIKPDRLCKRVIKEIVRIEPAIISGRVKVEDVKIALLGIYSSFLNLKPYVKDLRRVTGLFKDKKLRNLLIFKRIIAKRGKEAILSRK
jgi:hypothetical protein